MNIRLRASGLCLMFCVLSAAASAQTAAPGASSPAAEAAKANEAAAAVVDAAKASESCEDAVAETIRTIRGREAREIEFVGGKRTLSPGEGDDTAVKGAGRYRGAGGGSFPFTYTCSYNPRTGTASGAMFRETGARPTAVAETRPWQPDLTNVSPEACEAATAAALKDKYPRVGRIAFGSDTRRLQPAPNDRIGLEGQGAVQRAPGMNAAPFKYRCEIEPRSGKVVQVTTSD